MITRQSIFQIVDAAIIEVAAHKRKRKNKSACNCNLCRTVDEYMKRPQGNNHDPNYTP